MGVIDSMKLKNSFLNTHVNNLLNKVYNQKCIHSLKCEDCKKYKERKDDAVKRCKEFNVKNSRIIIKYAKKKMRVVFAILNTRK